jgi:hypothetical protein
MFAEGRMRGNPLASPHAIPQKCEHHVIDCKHAWSEAPTVRVACHHVDHLLTRTQSSVYMVTLITPLLPTADSGTPTKHDLIQMVPASALCM